MPTEQTKTEGLAAVASSDLLDGDHRSEIVRRIRTHLSCLAPEARARRTAQLLIEAVDLIEAAERVIESKLFGNDKPSNTQAQARPEQPKG
jgi:hypothetical protein